MVLREAQNHKNNKEFFPYFKLLVRYPFEIRNDPDRDILMYSYSVLIIFLLNHTISFSYCGKSTVYCFSKYEKDSLLIL